jgi:hypothetical protein
VSSLGCRARSRSWSTSNLKVGRRLGLGALSDADNTRAALHALDTAGRRNGDPARDAINYLMEHQAPQRKLQRLPNEAECAVDRLGGARPRRRTGPSDAIGSGLCYLRRRQRSDGAIRYPSSSQQTPVWVTAQALPPLRRKPFPLDPLPSRSCGAGRARSSACAAGAGLGFGHSAGGGPTRTAGAEARGRPRARADVRARAATRAAKGGVSGDSSGEGWRQRRTQPLGSPLS